MFYKNLQEFKEAAGYEISGDWYPRVTKIIEIKAKPALYKFYAELNSFNEGEEIKKQSAGEGTMVHEAIQNLLLGRPSDIPAGIKPSVDAFLRFTGQKKISVVPEYVERQVVNHDDKYAGTVDALAVIGGKLGVLDIKTSQSIYRDYNLQTSAYMAALENKINNLETRWILRIDQNKKCENCGAVCRSKGGREKIKPARNGYGYPLSFCPAGAHQWSQTQGEVELKEFPNWREDYSAFLGAKKLWEWENDYWLKQLNYP